MISILFDKYYPIQYLRNLNKNGYIQNKYTLEKIYLVNIWLDRVNQYFLPFFFSIVRISSCQSRFSSSITPRNLIAFFLWTWLFPIFKTGSFRGKSSLLDFLWKSVYLVFLLFKDNLFALNQSSVFVSSSLTFVKSYEYFYGNKKGLYRRQTLLDLNYRTYYWDHLHKLRITEVQVLTLEKHHKLLVTN